MTTPKPGQLAVAGRLRDAVVHEVRRWSLDLVSLSHSLHREPEVGLAEVRSSEKVAELLYRAGFVIERSVGGLETALVGTAGTGEMVIGLCAEYDALPGIGHACGHNVNGAAAVGAAIGLAAATEDLDITVKLIGTPAEETVGGKVYLLEAGVFDDVAAAMMVHAGAEDDVGSSSYALSVWDVVYSGVPAHAATAPWRGVNAADAVTLAYHAVGLLRQQLAPDNVVSFVIHEAGDAPNVVPARSRAVLELRARTRDELLRLQRAVRRCLDAGAIATGAEVDVRTRGREFADLVQDPLMTDAYVDAMAHLGRLAVDLSGVARASTDMGNVSHRIPSIHPTIGYEVGGAAHHTPQFADHGDSPSADRAVVDGASGLAMVGVRLAQDPDQRERLLRRLAIRRESEASGVTSATNSVASQENRGRSR